MLLKSTKSLSREQLEKEIVDFTNLLALLKDLHENHAGLMILPSSLRNQLMFGSIDIEQRINSIRHELVSRTERSK